MFKKVLVLFSCVFLFTVATAQTYMESGASYAPNTELIGRVLFGEAPWTSDDILNPSVSGVTNALCTGYSDFTIGNNNNADGNNLDLEFYRYVVRGATYDIEIQGDACASLSSLDRAVKVFIDYNDDGDFDDADEEVWTSPTLTSTTPLFSTSITIPNDAALDVLRMRVIYVRITAGIMVWLWDNMFNAEATSYTYGETEDYNLIVVGGLIDSIIVTDESCEGYSDGTLTVVPDVSAPVNIEYSITSALGPWTTSPVFTNLSPGNYTVWAIDSGTGDLELEEFVVNGAPSCFDIDLGIDIFSCAGDTLQLNAESVYNATYSWTPSLGMNDPTIPNPTISPTATTTYTLQVDSAGQVSNDDITVYVYPYPVFDVSPDQNLCSGETPANLSASWIPGATYTWNPTTALSSPNISQTSFISSISTTTYVVSVNLVGCAIEDSIVLNVSPIPTTTLSAIPNPACIGDNITLTAVTSIPVLKYRFQYNNGTGWQLVTTPGWGEDNPVIFNNINSTTDFRVRVMEDWGCTVSPWSPIITVPLNIITASPIIHN